MTAGDLIELGNGTRGIFLGQCVCSENCGYYWLRRSDNGCRSGYSKNLVSAKVLQKSAGPLHAFSVGDVVRRHPDGVVGTITQVLPLGSSPDYLVEGENGMRFEAKEPTLALTLSPVEREILSV